MVLSSFVSDCLRSLIKLKRNLDKNWLLQRLRGAVRLFGEELQSFFRRHAGLDFPRPLGRDTQACARVESQPAAGAGAGHQQGAGKGPHRSLPVIRQDAGGFEGCRGGACPAPGRAASSPLTPLGAGGGSLASCGDGGCFISISTSARGTASPHRTPASSPISPTPRAIPSLTARCARDSRRNWSSHPF